MSAVSCASQNRAHKSKQWKVTFRSIGIVHRSGYQHGHQHRQENDHLEIEKFRETMLID